MERILEPELMDDWAGAEAYANSDFSEPHNAFVARYKELFPNFTDPDRQRQVLDMGCGHADISRRFARAFPKAVVHGVDGSEPMLHFGNIAILAEGLSDRVKLRKAWLPDHNFGHRPQFHAVISNSLLHHLPNPSVLWDIVKELALPDAPIFVMDLTRPATPERAKELVELHSLPTDPELMKVDFYNSLRAAFRPEDVRIQLDEARLAQLHVEVVSDRHMMIYGRM